MAIAVIIAGEAEGLVLRHDAPLSFWGGVDPRSGMIIDRQSSRYGESIANRIFMLGSTRGSSSSSSVLLELIARGHAPSAIILGEIDAILGVGIIVGRELGYSTFPLLVMSPVEQAGFPNGARVRITGSGEIVSG